MGYSESSSQHSICLNTPRPKGTAQNRFLKTLHPKQVLKLFSIFGNHIKRVFRRLCLSRICEILSKLLHVNMSTMTLDSLENFRLRKEKSQLTPTLLGHICLKLLLHSKFQDTHFPCLRGPDLQYLHNDRRNSYTGLALQERHTKCECHFAISAWSHFFHSCSP